MDWDSSARLRLEKCRWWLRSQPLPPLFFFNDPATPEIYTLSLHDALPISGADAAVSAHLERRLRAHAAGHRRSEEHTSELQSQVHLVCRLLLEKKKEQTPRRIRRTCQKVRLTNAPGSAGR